MTDEEIAQIPPQAFEILNHRRTCQHEAAHAAAALLTGLDVHQAEAAYLTLHELEHGDLTSIVGEVKFRANGDLRACAMTVLAGPLHEDGRVHWPPNWPPDPASSVRDERQLADLVKELELDRKGYNALVNDAYDLVCTPEFNRLAVVIGDQLERHESLDGQTIIQLKSIAEGSTVEQMTLAAKSVTEIGTETGTFRAVISTASVDRDKDVVEPAAMVVALGKWAQIGKLVPLAWNHSQDVIGHIDPRSVAVEGGREVVAQGWIDRDTERGREAWRLVKSGTLSFSFGFLFNRDKAAKRPGGGYHISELDVFEISAIPVAPSNNETRVLEWKSLDDPDRDPDVERFGRQVYDEMCYLMRAASPVSEDKGLRAKSARSRGPVQVATFGC